MDSYGQIRIALRRKAWRLRTHLLVRGLAGILTLALVLLGLGVGLAGLIPVTGLLFFLFAVLSWVLLAAGAARLAARLAGRLDAEAVARLVEGRHPEVGGDLVSAVQLGACRERLVETLGYSGSMIDAVTDGAAGRLAGLAGRSLGDPRRLRASLLLLGAALAATLAAARLPGSGYGTVLALMVNPLEIRPFAGPALEVSPGNARLMEGDPLRIDVRARGRVGGEMLLETVDPAGLDGAAASPMEKLDPATWAAAFPKVVAPFRYRVRHRRAASPWYSVEVETEPRAGDVRVDLTFPAYSGLPPSSLEGGGDIRVLKGTVVRWRATANKPLSRASLVMAGGDSHPLRAEGLKLETEFIVTSGGRYRVELQDREGFSPRRPDEYEISLLPDEYPTVELVSPAEDLELDRAALVDILFAARDDFGLGEAHLVWRTEAGKGGRLKLPHAGGRRSWQSGYSWDLGGIELEPGQRVDMQVEVADNDSISGPKVGVSAARGIRIKDSRAVHRDLALQEKELLEELTDLLGDEIELQGAMEELQSPERLPAERFDSSMREAAASQERAGEKLDRSLEKMDGLLKSLAADPLAEPSSLYMKVLARQILGDMRDSERQQQKQLGELARLTDIPREDRAVEMKGLTREKEKSVARLEQALNMMQEGSRYQNMEEAIRSQERMVESQRDLMDRLERMKDGLDAKAAAELSAMLEQIARAMSDLMRSLTSMQSELPDEFVNADSMKDLPLDEVMKDLREMAEALERGDLERARKKAEDALRRMTELLERLKEAARQLEEFNRRGADELQRSRTDELSRIVEAQRRLLADTEKTAVAMAPRLEESRRGAEDLYRENMEKAAGLLEETLEELRRLFNRAESPPPPIPGALPELNRLLNQLRAASAEGNSEAAKALLEGAGGVMKDLAAALEKEGGHDPRAVQAAGEAARAADAAAAGGERAPEAAAATPGEKALLERMSGEQSALGERTLGLGRKVEALAKAFPVISPKLAQNLKEAAGFMEQAGAKLGALSPREAAPAQREALYRLMQAQSEAASAAGQMGKMAALRRGGAGSMDESGQLFGLLPGLMDSTRRGEREGGRMGISVRNFRIPGSEEYEVPRALREEIMESMKAGYPKDFEKSIRQYYRSITE